MSLGNLQNENDRREALARVREALDVSRTEYFEIQNHTTQFNLVLVLAEGYDTAGGQLPTGYVRDTGLVVTGTNVVPGTTGRGNVQAGINVQANLAKCHLHWKRVVQPFDEGDLGLDDQNAPAGEFFVSCGWAVEESRGDRPNLVARRSTRARSK